MTVIKGKTYRQIVGITKDENVSTLMIEIVRLDEDFVLSLYDDDGASDNGEHHWYLLHRQPLQLSEPAVKVGEKRF